MDGFFSKRKVIVTGGAGFLGSHVVAELIKLNCASIFIPRSNDYNLTQTEHVVRLYEDHKPDIVIHLAAVVGGIGANQKNPGKYFYENLIMGAQLIEYGRIFGLEKFVAVGTVCSYPKHCQIPFKESSIWDGYPEETNAPYGLAKKMMLVQSQAYRTQYGFNSIILLPANLYGPKDNFNLETSHVIPALIRKCVTAKLKQLPEIILWGNGSATREFLYVKDAAVGILSATECYNESTLVNLGTGSEITIATLAEIIAELTDFTGRINWDYTRPNGQPRRLLDVSLAKKAFNFKATTKLHDGLKATINWYRENSH